MAQEALLILPCGSAFLTYPFGCLHNTCSLCVQVTRASGIAHGVDPTDILRFEVF